MDVGISRVRDVFADPIHSKVLLFYRSREG
jgi:hypothetical protein